MFTDRQVHHRCSMLRSGRKHIHSPPWITSHWAESGEPPLVDSGNTSDLAAVTSSDLEILLVVFDICSGTAFRLITYNIRMNLSDVICVSSGDKVYTPDLDIRNQGQLKDYCQLALISVLSGVCVPCPFNAVLVRFYCGSYSLLIDSLIWFIIWNS